MLTVELIPPTSWGNNLRNQLGREKWSKLCEIIYLRANRNCEVCGGHEEKHRVECHEVWQYDDDNHIQKLIDLIALCPQCHRVKHIGRSRAMGTYNDSLNHIMMVNNWTKKQAEKHISQAVKECLRRGRFKWIVDVSKVEEILNGKQS